MLVDLAGAIHLGQCINASRDLRTGFLPARLGRHKLHSFSCRILRLISGIYVLPTLLVREVPTPRGIDRMRDDSTRILHVWCRIR